MDPIKITFLGTSNAIPTSQRNHPSIHLEWNGEHLLFDCGEGTQRQMKKANLNPCKLTRIFITHLHGDHVLGLPGLFETLEMLQYSKTLEIYGPQGTQKHISLLQQLYGRFNIKHKVIEINAHANSIVLETKDFQIQSSHMDHNVPTLAYSFAIKEKLRILKSKLKKLKLPNSPLIHKLQQGHDIVFDGKKIKSSSVTYKQEGKRITIILDTKLNNNAISLAKNSDLLVCESTYAQSEKDYASEYKHLTSTQAATIAKKAKAKKLILTHIAQRYEHNPKIIESEAKKVFKNVSIAKDLDIIKI